jgi:Tfp pilus assembly protein PilX
MTQLGHYRYRERGATSLIVVMFSVLLFAVVVVGFLQLMTHEQESSTDNELSRGAYDSALAGVEDGKRVLKGCLNGDTSACDAINAGKCTTISDAGFTQLTDGEVYLKSVASSGLTDTQYEQAYTCVKIALNTADYLGNLSAANSSTTLIPLKTATEATQVQLQWFMTSAGMTSTLKDATHVELPARSAWTYDKPPVIRVDLINLKAGATVNSLDTSTGAWTLYLYPQQKSMLDSSTSYNIGDQDSRSHSGSSANAPRGVSCDTAKLSSYACNVTLALPGGVDTTGNDVYIRLTALYNSTDFVLAPQASDSTSISYVRVQPSIDSTGRAADVFRRVEARVESTDDQTAYPRATIDITNNLCKTVSVTDQASEYSAGGCTP